MDKNTVDVGFPERLTEVIKFTGLSQAAFARKIMLSPAAVTEMLKGRSNPSDRTVNLICSTFSISENWLTIGEGGMLEIYQPNLTGRFSSGGESNKANDHQPTYNPPMDRDLLIEAATIIRLAEIEAKVTIRADMLGKLILQLHDEYAAGRQVEKAKVVSLVKAWAA